MRTVVVGDVHGCFEELVELLDEVRLAPDDLLVSVGDLVDRGPAPGEVVRLFRERPNSVVVMGNHERKHVRGIFSYAQEITRLQLGDRYAETVEWMRTLPYFFENEHLRVVHAALLSGIPPAEQKEEILCGSTTGERELAALFPGSYWPDHYTDPVPVAFGHHVVGPEPMVRDGRIFGLDTGACHGGRLTALCVPGFTIHSVAAHADHWAITKRRWQEPVLKTRPWLDFTWAELTRTAGKFAGDWPTAVEEWAADLRSLVPVLVAAADRLAGELTAEQTRRHPAARFVFPAREGRTTVAQFCTTPRRTIEAAAALGVPAPGLPR